MGIVEKFGIGTLVFGVILTLLWNVLAGGLPTPIALSGLVYWMISLLLFRFLKFSVSNFWQGIVFALLIVLVIGYLIHF